MIGVSSAQGIEADCINAQVELAAYQAIGPQAVGVEASAQQAYGTQLRSAADKDHHSLRLGLKIGPPGGGQRAPFRGVLDAAAARWR